MLDGQAGNNGPSVCAKSSLILCIRPMQFFAALMVRILFLLVLLFWGFTGECQLVGNNSWSNAMMHHRATITAYWYESKPFIYQDPDGEMRGIEPDIMEGFRKYVRDRYQVELQVIWKEGSSFVDTYHIISTGRENGTLGVSAFSITPERQREVGFTPPYMSDISVLIASKNIPIVSNTEEFQQVFSKLTAIAIKGTTYEVDLIKLRESGNLSFNIKYIPSSQNILYTIERTDSAFGFIDLPVYMKIFTENPSINVTRQNLFPVKRQGYAFVFPIGSDWSYPLDAYFNDSKFKARLESTISKYIDIDLYRFVEGLAIQSDDPVILLTKEKEIQRRAILGKSEEIAVETRRKNFLIALVAICLASLVMIIYLYRKRNEQKEQIE